MSPTSYTMVSRYAWAIYIQIWISRTNNKPTTLISAEWLCSVQRSWYMNQLHAGIVKMVWQYAESHIAVLSDEMKVKERLVYWKTHRLCWHWCRICALHTCWWAAECDTCSCVMIRGFDSNFKLSSASYATTTGPAEQIYVKFWELVGALELYGLKVRCFIDNGASYNNWTFIRAVTTLMTTITNRAVSAFNTDKDINFVSDAPHLVIKMTKAYLTISNPW